MSGAVNAPISVAFVPGQNMDFYVGAAGGFSQKADGGRSYVTQPNGKVESVKRRFLLADGSPRPRPAPLSLYRENTDSAQGDSRHVGSPGSDSREPHDRDSRAQEEPPPELPYDGRRRFRRKFGAAPSSLAPDRRYRWECDLPSLVG
jgi:hypothetical protein